jgi:uncharacterized damage-inducible protein DinB
MSISPAYLASQLERTITGPTWHGNALGELLADVTAAEARAHPISGAHSIAELAAHLTAWTVICLRRLEGETGEATDAEDWPAPEASTEAQWRASVRRLGEQYAAVARATRKLPESTLLAMLPGRDHTAADMLQGLVEHGAYHGGQIALLKKAVRGTAKRAP